MGAFDELGHFADDLAAGDEVEDATDVLRHISQQLEALGGGDAAPQPLGHISVPRDAPKLAVPAGTVTINFRDGFVSHPDLGRFVDNLVTVEDLTDQYDGESMQLKNVIFHSDTAAQVRIKEGGQWVPLDYVPLPSRNFDQIQVELDHPGNLIVMASTRELPIGIGAINLYASRYGEASGTFDNLNAVPVSPHTLWNEHGSTHADPTLWTAAYDSTTWTVDNTGGNELKVVIEAAENTGPLGQWREIASDTIPSGDHSTFHVGQRHHYMRTRITNTTGGQNVSSIVEATEGSP